MNSIGAYMPQSSLAIDHIDYVNVYVVYVIYGLAKLRQSTCTCRY